MVLVKLGEHLSNVIDNQLWQFSIVILNDKTEKFAKVVVNNVSYLFSKWKWSQLFPFELGVILGDF
jgi:hypothetical protein